MGDEFMADLVSSLGLSSTAGGKGNNTIQPTDPSNNITVTVEVNGVATKYVPA
jgi:hypothetical protein